MTVRAEKVRFSYGSHKALDGVDVQVGKASILAILGPNGSGKTTLLRILQGLGIALALVGDPRLLFLDEPTNALDPSGILEIRELVRSLPKATGATVFFASHNLAEVERVADQLLVLKDGVSQYLGSMEGYGGSTDTTAWVRVARPDLAARLLRERGLPHVVQGDALEVSLQGTSIEGLAELQVLGGCGLREIGILKRSLEEKYHEQMD